MQSVTSRKTKIILFLIIIILFSAVSLLAANTAFMVTNNIYQGVSVGDIHVGGLSAAEAKRKISTVFSERTKHNPFITAVYNEQKWGISAQDIELTIQADKLAQQAYEVGRKGNIIHQLQERYIAINKGHSLALTVQYNNDKL